MRDYSTFNEALQANKEPQQSEVVDTTSVNATRAHVVGGGGRVHQPPEDILTNIETYLSIPIVYQGVNKFASDVTEPGWRVTADNDRTETELNDWGENAAVVGGERHSDVQGLFRQACVVHEVTGNIATEHVKPKKDSKKITGMRNVPVESLRAHTEDNSSILTPPDSDNNPRTARGEAAAYTQWHHRSVLGQRGNIPSDRSEIHLSQNDITKTANSPGPADIWGTSPLSTIPARARALESKLRDNEDAIKSKAYGIWSVAFDRETIDIDGMEPELIEWSDPDQDEFMDRLGALEPGQVVGHDGSVSFKQFNGEVADILEYLLFDIDYILSAVAPPKYAVGYGEDITQHVTERQSENYEDKKTELRGVLENHYTPMFVKRAEQQNLPTDGIELKIEPPEEESPIRSLSSEKIADIKTYMEALKMASPSGNPTDVINEDSLRELVLQLPDDAAPDDDIADSIEDGEVTGPTIPIPNMTEGGGDDQGQPALPDGGEDEDEGEDDG